MKKLFVFICFFAVNIILNILYAQNTLVYFRYDIIPDDIGKIISIIDSVKEETEGRFVLYYENQSFENNKYDELVSSKDFLRYTSIYEPENEEFYFSKFNTDILKESANETLLIGSDDKEWKYIFVLSDVAQKKDLMRLISIHSLHKRVDRIQFIIFDERSNVRKQSYKHIVEDNSIMLLDY